MLFIGVAVWLVALKLANQSSGPRALVLGLCVGGAFSLTSWLDVILFKSPVLTALIATILFFAVGAALLIWFARLEGVLTSLAVVVLGTLLLVWGVPGVAASIAGTFSTAQ